MMLSYVIFSTSWRKQARDSATDWPQEMFESETFGLNDMNETASRKKKRRTEIGNIKNRMHGKTSQTHTRARQVANLHRVHAFRREGEFLKPDLVPLFRRRNFISLGGK